MFTAVKHASSQASHCNLVTKWPTEPWRTIAIDIAGEFQAAPSHQRFVVVAVDLHSKWPEVMMCGTVTTTNIIEFLTSPFSRFGLSNLGTKHSCTTMYSPRMELLSVSIVF